MLFSDSNETEIFSGRKKDTLILTLRRKGQTVDFHLWVQTKTCPTLSPEHICEPKFY